VGTWGYFFFRLLPVLSLVVFFGYFFTVELLHEPARDCVASSFTGRVLDLSGVNCARNSGARSWWRSV